MINVLQDIVFAVLNHSGSVHAYLYLAALMSNVNKIRKDGVVTTYLIIV